jgi:hypothetical protein
MAVAIEDSGFEVRDSLMWLYGTGFPKSHDVAKGIDKLRDDDRAELYRVTGWIAAARDRAGLTNRDLDDAFGFAGMAGHWTSLKSQPSIPTPGQWPRLLEVLGGDAPAEIADLVARLNARKGEPGEAWHDREVVGSVEYGRTEAGSWASHVSGGMFKAGERVHAITRASDQACAWEGWGTALKPAFEPIVLARKPIAEGSIARQVLATGTGAINIGECRIERRERTDYCLRNACRTPGSVYGAPSASADFDASKGRWPANVLHDGSREVLDRFPIDGEGTVARFFYSAKADAGDRRGSDHPTVKPQALMRWLVRLVCPRGGLVLDPFGGSGSTAWAAAAEGRRAVLIEREAEYLADLRRNVTRLEGRIDQAESTWRAEIEALATTADPAEADRLRKRLEKSHPDDFADPAIQAHAAPLQTDLFGGPAE